METNTYERLVEIMARMAAGDRAFIVTLYQEYGGHIAALVRRRLRHLGIHQVAGAEVNDFVLDVCFALFDCAGSWDPAGGALPWNWAERRLASMIARSVGDFGDPLSDEVADRLAEEDSRAVGRDIAGLDVLATLRGCHDGCRLVAEAFEQARLSPRDRAVVLEYAVQERSGDRSPSHTVGAEFGLAPSNVRQIVKRSRDKLRDLAEADERYSTLADLPLLAS